MISIGGWWKLPRGTRGDLFLLVSREELVRLLASLDRGGSIEVTAPIEGAPDRVGDVKLYAVERTDAAALREIEARLRQTGTKTYVQARGDRAMIRTFLRWLLSPLRPSPAIVEHRILSKGASIERRPGESLREARERLDRAVRDANVAEVKR